MSFPLLISSTAAADITPLFYATVSGILKPDTGFKQHRRSSIRTATVSGERERERERNLLIIKVNAKKSAATEQWRLVVTRKLEKGKTF